MERFRSLLAGLNLTEQDNAVIRSAGKITRLFRSKEVRFIHVAGGSGIPDEVSKEYPELLEPSVDQIQKIMEEKVKEHFLGAADEVACEVVEGKPIDMLLRHVTEKNVDLMVVGRKSWKEASGHVAEQLARKAPCSVLIIPEKRELALENILVGTDFSSHSKEAMDMALVLATGIDSARIVCIHIIEYLPAHESPAGSHNGFLELLRRVAREDLDKFLSQFNYQGTDVSSVIKAERNPAVGIRDFIWKHKTDLIIVGARGRTSAAATLLGSVTENLIRMTNTPILAVKRKGENMNLLRALLGLEK